MPLLTGEKKENLVGRQLRDIDNTVIKELLRDAGAAAPEAGGDGAADRSCTLKGELHHFRVKRGPTAFEDGALGLTFIIEDVTARRKYEQMLEISEARYRGLVRSSGEAIIGTTPDGTIVSWNPAAEKVYGYT